MPESTEMRQLNCALSRDPAERFAADDFAAAFSGTRS
jgi:hypothetical protein